MGGGSGFIVREDGLVVTNAHLFMGHRGRSVNVSEFHVKTRRLQNTVILYGNLRLNLACVSFCSLISKKNVLSLTGCSIRSNFKIQQGVSSKK